MNAAFIGSNSFDWTVLATRLTQARLLDAADAYRITLLWWYGRLIGNADMHLGNLSFWPRDRLVLAPAYDMLPMLYAPLPGGELPAREFSSPLPLPGQREAWSESAEAAIVFWGRAASDGSISASFRATCAANANRVRALASAL